MLKIARLSILVTTLAFSLFFAFPRDANAGQWCGQGYIDVNCGFNPNACPGGDPDCPGCCGEYCASVGCDVDACVW